MRIKPVVPFLMLQALRDTQVAGIRVPADTLVWGALRVDSMREEYFADASRFEPERWLEGTARHGAASASRVSMPFGAGPRVCPGRQLAMLEMKIALATLLGSFDIESVDAATAASPTSAVVHDGARPA